MLFTREASVPCNLGSPDDGIIIQTELPQSTSCCQHPIVSLFKNSTRMDYIRGTCILSMQELGGGSEKLFILSGLNSRGDNSLETMALIRTRGEGFGIRIRP